MLRSVICTGRIMLWLLLLNGPFTSRPDNDDEFMPGWLKTLTHLNPLTYVLDAMRTFMLAGSTLATRVSGLSLRGLNLICRNAAQISNKP
jgi:hypothetical protein